MTLRIISRLALLTTLLCSAGCYYLKQPTDVTDDREFAWLKGKCVELTMPVYLVRYTGVVAIPEERLSLAIPGEMGLYKLPPATEWPRSNGKKVGDTRVVGLLPAGTRLAIERLVETYPGAGPSVLTLVRVGSGEGDIASIKELGFRGFPRRKHEPFGATVVACDSPKTVQDSTKEPGRSSVGE